MKRDYKFIECRDDWIYELNDRIPWVDEKPWTDKEECAELMSDIRHQCSHLRFRIGTAKWPTYSELKEEALRNKRILEESMNQDEESSNGDWSNYSTIDECGDGAGRDGAAATGLKITATSLVAVELTRNPIYDPIGWSSRVNLKTSPRGGSNELKFLAFGEMGKAPRDASVEHYIQMNAHELLNTF
nr:probable inactive purple acid phosphatase 27 [Tanacetum cinerariifolium]